jgi:phosphatidate cytidylyltransferase
MKRVATAVVLIPLVLLAVLRAPVPVLAAVVALVALVTVREFLGLAEHYGVEPLRWPTYIFVGVLFTFIAVGAGGPKPLLAASVTVYTAGVAAVFAPFVFLAIGMKREVLSTALPAAATSVVAFTYVALPLALLVQVRQLWAGAFLLIYLLVVVWAGDTFAYYAGRALGRHKMAPRISPGKTWEGAAASLVGAVVVGTLMFDNALPISSWLLRAGLIERSQGYLALEKVALMPVVVLTAIINIAAQLGDLVESLLKRGAGVKDSGRLLPGHGGMLDRIDALLFAAPVLWYYAALRAMA